MRRIIVLSIVAAALTGMVLPTAVIATENATDTEDDEPSEILLDLGDVRVVDVEWGDSATVTVENTESTSTSVTITDVSPLDGNAGGATVEDERIRLSGEETATVEIPLAQPDNPQLSLDAQQVGLLEGDSDRFNPFSGVSASWGLVRVAALSAGGGGALMIGLVGWSAVADRHDSAELVDP